MLRLTYWNDNDRKSRTYKNYSAADQALKQFKRDGRASGGYVLEEIKDPLPMLNVWGIPTIFLGGFGDGTNRPI